MIKDGNPEHVAHRLVISDKKSDTDCYRSNQMPFTDQIREIVPYMCTYFWVTIQYEYNDISKDHPFYCQ